MKDTQFDITAEKLDKIISLLRIQAKKLNAFYPDYFPDYNIPIITNSATLKCTCNKKNEITAIMPLSST